MKAVSTMKKVNKFLLGAIQALVDLGIISNGLLGIGFLIVGPIYIFTDAISFKQIGNNWGIEFLLYLDILFFMAIFCTVVLLYITSSTILIFRNTLLLQTW